MLYGCQRQKYLMINRMFLIVVPFWRVESSTTTMPQQLYHQLLIEKTTKIDGWELAKAKEFTVDDLDTNEILRTIDESIQRAEWRHVLQRMIQLKH